MREDERRAVDLRDDLGHRKGLARTGDAKEHLVLIAAFDTANQLPDRLRLVSAGFVIADKFEIHCFEGAQRRFARPG